MKAIIYSYKDEVLDFNILIKINNKNFLFLFLVNKSLYK